MIPKKSQDWATLCFFIKKLTVGLHSHNEWGTQQGRSMTCLSSMSMDGLHCRPHPISPLRCLWVNFTKFMHRTTYWFTVFATSSVVLTALPANPHGQPLGCSAVLITDQILWMVTLDEELFDEVGRRGIEGAGVCASFWGMCSRSYALVLTNSKVAWELKLQQNHRRERLHWPGTKRPEF